MLLKANLIIFSILHVCITQAVGSENIGKNSIPCGLHGFRCIDSKHAEICLKKHKAASTKPKIFKCSEGMKCDEDKKEFCSPSSNCSCPECKNVMHKAKREIFIHKKLYADSLSDTIDYEDESTAPERDEWNGNPPITCNMLGFYPG